MPETMETTEEVKITRLQQAALQLIHLINSSLDSTYAEHKIRGGSGMFSLAASGTVMNAKMMEIKKGKFNFAQLGQIERANLLKRVLRELQEKNTPLFSAEQLEYLKAQAPNGAINNLWDKQSQENNKKIAFCLIGLIKHLLEKENIKNRALDDLSMIFARHLFPAEKLKAPAASEQITAQEMAHKSKLIVDLIARSHEIPKINMSLESIHYDYEVSSQENNRFHLFSVHGHGLDGELQSCTGDFLKSKILLRFKKQLEEASADNIDKVVEDIQGSRAYTVLTQGQGMVTRFFRLETSSVKAFNEMVAERKDYFDLARRVSPAYK